MIRSLLTVFVFFPITCFSQYDMSNEYTAYQITEKCEIAIKSTFREYTENRDSKPINECESTNALILVDLVGENIHLINLLPDINHEVSFLGQVTSEKDGDINSNIFYGKNEFLFIIYRDGYYNLNLKLDSLSYQLHGSLLKNKE